MCFERILPVLALMTAMLYVSSCGEGRKLAVIRKGDISAQLSIPSDEDYIRERDEAVEAIRIDSLPVDDGPLIMNAIKDESTGEMVAVDVISASKVVARFRNVAERFGKISLEFDISVPQTMMESRWKLEFSPLMKMHGDSTWLDPVYITGEKYREEQMRGYRRYQDFLSSIITDSLDFLRIAQLEIFIRRHYPETYAMKNDSSFVPDPVAENIFGVTQRQALEHYTKHGLWQRNERRKANRGKMFHKYVKDPLGTGGPRLDTVIAGQDGSLVYRYVQEVAARPGLKKIAISLDGSLYEDGKCICRLPAPDDLTFYVSSLSTLADMTPRYVIRVVERTVYDNTHAFIDFAQGSSAIDTLLPGNADELRRVRKCVDDIMAREELALDSLMVRASCSPEGRFRSNAVLASSRAEAVTQYLGGFLDEDNAKLLRSGAIPENWEQFARLAVSDTVISEKCRKKIQEAAATDARLATSGGMAVGKSRDAMSGDSLDVAERELSMMPEYRYLREKLYPKLRTVRFDFYLHRKGMLKDTVHTTEIDSVYLAGVLAIKEMDYKKAVELLRPYHDYNTALAYLSAGYNHSALADIETVSPATAASDYLKAVVLSRLGRRKEALESYLKSVEKDPLMVHRANLDPELSELTRLLDDR